MFQFCIQHSKDYGLILRYPKSVILSAGSPPLVNVNVVFNQVLSGPCCFPGAVQSRLEPAGSPPLVNVNVSLTKYWVAHVGCAGPVQSRLEHAGRPPLVNVNVSLSKYWVAHVVFQAQFNQGWSLLAAHHSLMLMCL